MKKYNNTKRPATMLKSVVLFFLFTAMMGNWGWGQCTNTSSYGTATAPTSGQITIKTDQWEQEYNTINSVAASTVYTSEINNSGDYITVRAGSSSGTLIAFGPTPLTWTSTSAGTYYIHYNTNSSCGTASVNRTSKLTYIGPACTATLTLASNTVAAANICAGTTKVPLQSFSLAVSGGCNGNLTNVGFTTTGTYVQADISKYQLWYNTSNTLTGATQLGTDLASSGGAGARTFAAFSNPTSPALASGSTYYFWITADVASGATNNNTIAVNAITTGNLTSTSNKAGSTTAGGTQTFIGTPTTATNTSTQSICGGSAILSGNTPTIGTGAWTVVSGPSTLSTQFANTAIYNTTFTSAGGDGNYVLRWTISNSCSSSSADATVTVSSSAPSCATLTSPANGATGQLVPGVTLSWNAVSGATGYDIYLQAGTNPPVTQAASNQAGTTYATGALSPSTTYYWYVVPRNACGGASGCSASAFSFTTGSCVANIYVTATAGTLTGSYSTLKLAFDAINAGTHNGIINILIGKNTTETATAALNASGSGSASYTSVHIQPCSGSYEIKGSLSGVPVINLNGADNVTINGINSGGNLLTIANTSATAGSSSIQFINDASNNIVRNCNIYSSNISTSSGTIVFSTTTGTTGNDNNTIEYCNIYDGSTAPYVGIYSSGTTATTAHYNSNNTISNNKIYNFLYPAGNEGITAPSGGNFFTGTDYGIKISTGNTAWTISNNSLYRTNTTSYTNTTFDATHFGIYISTDGDGFTVSNNYIGGSDVNCGCSTPWTLNGATSLSNYRGIQIKAGNTTASTVSDNVIANILLKTSAAGTSYGAPFIGIHLNGNFTVIGNKVGDHAYGIIEVSGTSSNSDFNGIFYYNEATTGPASLTISGNTIANIKNTNTSGNASFYGIRCFTQECSINMTCSNNIVGATNANSIYLNGSTSSWVHGIFVSGLTTAVVSGNTVRSITSNSGEINGIKLQDSYFSYKPATPPNIEIVSNTIYNLNCTGGTVYGIINKPQTDATPAYAYATQNVIHRNFIYSLTAPTVHGIIESSMYSGFVDYIRNNMIALGNGSDGNTYNGISFAPGVTNGNCDIYHNSIYIGGTATASNSKGISKSVAATACNIKGNISYNARTGSGTHYALYYDNTTGLTSDCNDLYVPSAKAGYAPSSTYNTLALWQAGTVYDDNSVTIDPGFLSLVVPINLHVDSGIRVLNCTGLVTNDFDGDGRSTPHMGADESTITLPVSLLAFEANCNNENVWVSWATASEENNDYFTLERSADAKKWIAIARVPGAGNSNEVLHYNYTDKEAGEGLKYYRLSQTDYDGRSETFNIVTADCEQGPTPSLVLYPNPVNEVLVLQFANIIADRATISVMDITGRTVLNRTLESSSLQDQTVTLDLGSLSQGSYIIRFAAGDFIELRHVVKE